MVQEAKQEKGTLQDRIPGHSGGVETVSVGSPVGLKVLGGDSVDALDVCRSTGLTTGVTVNRDYTILLGSIRNR